MSSGPARGQAVPLVLVHGNPENALIWGPVLKLLDREDVVIVSPPGFGAPLPSGFASTVAGYRTWLLVGHDWGAAHVAQVAMHRPDLVLSWVSDQLNLFAPDYLWHPFAQVWQRPGDGEASVAEIFGGSFQQRLAFVHQMGITNYMAERVAAAFDETMGVAVLSLLRSAVQPEMADQAWALSHARQKPGLALVPTGDVNATEAMHRWAADQAGTKVAVLPDVVHWWPEMDPEPAVHAMTSFWSSLPSP